MYGKAQHVPSLPEYSQAELDLVKQRPGLSLGPRATPPHPVTGGSPPILREMMRTP